VGAWWMVHFWVRRRKIPSANVSSTNRIREKALLYYNEGKESAGGTGTYASPPDRFLVPSQSLVAFGIEVIQNFSCVATEDGVYGAVLSEGPDGRISHVEGR